MAKFYETKPVITDSEGYIIPKKTQEIGAKQFYCSLKNTGL